MGFILHSVELQHYVSVFRDQKKLNSWWAHDGMGFGDERPPPRIMEASFEVSKSISMKDMCQLLGLYEDYKLHSIMFCRF